MAEQDYRVNLGDEDYPNDAFDVAEYAKSLVSSHLPTGVFSMGIRPIETRPTLIIDYINDSLENSDIAAAAKSPDSGMADVIDLNSRRHS